MRRLATLTCILFLFFPFDTLADERARPSGIPLTELEDACLIKPLNLEDSYEEND